MDISSWFKNRKENKKQTKISDFMDATQAFQKSTFSVQYTKQELTDKLILDLQDDIKTQTKDKYGNSCMVIRTYSGSREKDVLGDVVKYFVEKGYHVDLHNGPCYQDTNVLIINYQGLDSFKK